MDSQRSRSARHALIAFAIAAGLPLAVAKQQYSANPSASPRPIDSQADLTYTQLENIIRSNDVRSIDQLLPLLPLEYRKNYSFIFESRSDQKDAVTQNCPRAMVYGANAKLILTFTKDPAKPPVRNALDRLEILDNSVPGESKLRRIIMDGTSDPLAKPIPVNPPECLSCHGNPPRPIWDQYNIWPGIYGALSRQYCDVMTQGSIEQTRYRAFMRECRNSARYRELPPELPNNIPPTHPAMENCEGIEPGLVPVPNAARSDPNSHLTDLLTDINAARVRSIIRASPDFSKLKYAIAAVSKQCPEVREAGLESFFPSSFRSAVPGFFDTQREVVKVFQEQLRKRKARFNRHSTARRDVTFRILEAETDDLYSIVQMKYFANAMGLDMNQWSMGFDDGTYAFFSGARVASEVWDTFDDEFKEVSCEELKRRSLAAIPEGECPRKSSEILTSAQNTSAAELGEIARQAIRDDIFARFRKCSECHAQDSHRIAFRTESEESWQAQLKSDPQLAIRIMERLRGVDANGRPIVRMPIGEPAYDDRLLSDIQRYLQRLLK